MWLKLIIGKQDKLEIVAHLILQVNAKRRSKMLILRGDILFYQYGYWRHIYDWSCHYWYKPRDTVLLPLMKNNYGERRLFIVDGSSIGDINTRRTIVTISWRDNYIHRDDRHDIMTWRARASLRRLSRMRDNQVGPPSIIKWRLDLGNPAAAQPTLGSFQQLPNPPLSCILIGSIKMAIRVDADRHWDAFSYRDGIG